MYNVELKNQMDLNSYNSNNFLNIKNELSYSNSINNNDSIDNRVLKVCSDAENSYLQNQKAIKEIQQLKNNNLKFIKLDTSTRIKNYQQINDINMLNYDFVGDYNKITDNNNKNVQIDNNNKAKIIQKDSHEVNKLNEDKVNNSYYNLANQSINFANKTMNRNENKINPLLFSSKTFINNKLQNSHSHSHLKSGKKCVACELKRKY
jgi:hypothetical protein